MAKTSIAGARIAGIATSVPKNVVNNADLTHLFSEQELRKVIGMVGIHSRHTSDGSLCSTDLCLAAAYDLIHGLDWNPASIDAVIMVTQSPDYLLPSSSCLIHRDLGLGEDCAAFDVGLGCSGYPYGLWLAHMLVAAGQCRRVLMLHGETPSLFANPEDRATALLFGDAGSATAVEADPSATDCWHYNLKTDGQGYRALIIEAGGFRERSSTDLSKYYVNMNGPQLFTFTTRQVPLLIEETLQLAGQTADDIDHFVFHQANRFITKHITKRMNIPDSKTPSTIENYGNTGGVSVPLTITQGVKTIDRDSTRLMALGYGVGLSWSSALFTLNKDTFISHSELKTAD
ncbi:MAG: ketoacyl-ACP synthase III [Cellvibrionaceae bacterium]